MHSEAGRRLYTYENSSSSKKTTHGGVANEKKVINFFDCGLTVEANLYL